MSNSTKTKNDSAWEKLFKQHKIIENIKKDGQFIINSRAINEFREARLMTKFDYRSNLPTLFQENQLSILPITRGDYAIAGFEAYKSFEQNSDSPIEYLKFPEHIQSIDYENITSEATAVNCAYVSGIFAHFLEEEELLPTVSGRMSSESFDFEITDLKHSNLINLNVVNSQIEIDGGYEGIGSLSLIEAKNSISSDFLVRQLYYPFRLWENKIAKEVKPIFLIYTNGIFYLYEYNFENPQNYNSLVLIKQQRYSLETKDISLEDIQNILKTTITVSEPEIPFPQADSFERVINLCELLNEQTELTKDDVTTTYDFDKRQTDYYTNAGRYLGLIEKKNDDGIKFFLTDEGKSLFKRNYKQRQLRLVELILKHSAFSNSLALYFKKVDVPTKSEIVEIMRHSNLYNVNTEKTFSRRASTILGWINWILSLQE